MSSRGIMNGAVLGAMLWVVILMGAWWVLQ